jgi:hypothetical protein
MKQKVWSYFLMLTLATGWVACSHDDDGLTDPKKGSTYIGISISFPQPANLRSANYDEDDYNQTGTYGGQTWINTLDIYVLSSDGTTLQGSQRWAANEIAYSLDATGRAVLEPKEPFLTTAGDKVVVAVVNSNQPLLTTAPPADYSYQLSASLTLADLGSVVESLDLIVMTGKSGVTTIVDGVTSDQVKAGQNRVALNAVRVVSRAIVTTSASPNVVSSTGTTTGTMSNITYSIVQGANAVYFYPQIEGTDYKTWGYDYVPVTDYATQASTYYDYTDLPNATPVPADPSTAADPRAFLKLSGKFLLENTHVTGPDVSTSTYKKGNTAYILIRATFTPDASAITDGGTLTDGTFYVGATDGKIYSSIAAATTPSVGGTGWQDVSTYQNGKVLYFVWLNPDNITKPMNSPVIRNNIYHVNINSFKTIGVNWNPLVPSDVPNPDPKPAGDEPDNPIVPSDPLSLSETYMSVDITVLDWTVHSIGIDL